MYSKLIYDSGKDLQPIILLGESQGVLVVHPSLPVRNVKEFIALAKARPGELNYGSAGAGTAISYPSATIENRRVSYPANRVSQERTNPSMNPRGS